MRTDAPSADPRTPRILIDVSGGIVQSIQADGPVEILVYDTDDPPEACEKDQVATVSPEEIDPYFEASERGRPDERENGCENDCEA
ncbi:MAG: hypothetical protein WCY59_02715 [Anaerovoracaceae bacterium]